MGPGLVGTNHGAGAGATAVGAKFDLGAMPLEDIWLDSDVSWGSLVVARVGSGCLVRIHVSSGH